MKFMPILAALLLLIFKAMGQDTIRSQSEIFNNSRPKKNYLLKTSAALGYAVFSISTYKFFDSRLHEESQEHKNVIKSDIANIGTFLGTGRNEWIGLATTTGFSFLTGNKKLQKTSILWAGSLFINDQITYYLKTTFQRHRPDTGDPYNSFDWSHGTHGNHSFPSSHTSYAFTTATIFATMYKDKKWVPPLVYGLATIVGLSRIYNNAHWASDVLAGAAIGFITAKTMTGLYNMANKKSITFIPQVGNKSGSLKLIYRF